MLFVDIEATGLDFRKHSIISIGAIDFHHPDNQFYQECRPWDGAEIMDEALQIHGFTQEQLEDLSLPSLEQTMKYFLAWTKTCKGVTISGICSWFDRDFLKDAAEKYNLDWVFNHRVIDVHSICVAHILQHGGNLPRKNGYLAVNTDFIFPYVGLPEEPRPHHALNGAKMSAEAFSRLVFKKSLLKEFESYLIPF